MEVSEQHHVVEGLTEERNYVAFQGEGAHTYPSPAQNRNPGYPLFQIFVAQSHRRRSFRVPTDPFCGKKIRGIVSWRMF